MWILYRMSLLAFVALCWFASCSDDDGGSDKPDVPDVPGDTATVITSAAALPAWEGAEGLETVWTDDDDTFVAFRDDERTTPLVFSRTESGDFESEEEITSPAGTYYVAWREAEDAGAMAIDLTEQDGTWGDGKKYMAATATCTEEGKMDFAFTNLTAILKFELTLPVVCVGPVLNASLSASGLKINNTVDVTKSPVEYGSGTTGALSYECRLDLSSDKMVTVYPKSVIRISQCCMAMRNPLISPRWTGKTALFLKTLPDRGYACPLFCPNKPVLRLTRIG